MQCVNFGLLPFHLHLILSDIYHFGSNELYLCVCFSFLWGAALGLCCYAQALHLWHVGFFSRYSAQA